MREIPRSRLRPPPCSQPQRGPGVLAGGRPNRRGCVPGRAGQMRPSSSLSPKPPHAELCAPGSGKSLAQGGDNIEARAMDRNTGVSAHPSKPPGTGILAVLGSAVKPPGAGSIPSARSPESRRGALKPRAPPAGPGCFVPGGPGDAAARDLDTEVRWLGKRGRQPAASPTWSPGLQAPRVREGSSHSCKEGAKYVFQTFHGSKLSASIKRSGVRGKAFWVLACK